MSQLAARWAARSFFAAALALALAGPAHAMTAWDQVKVTELAKNLRDSVDGLRDAIRDSPQWNFSQQKSILYQIRDNLRWIETESGSLYAMLSNGEGMEATLNSYKRIQMLKRDTQSLAQQTQVSAFTQPALDKAKGALDALAAYYPADAANP